MRRRPRYWANGARQVVSPEADKRHCRNCGREILGKRAAVAVLCAGCRSEGAIPEATASKVRRRGWQPIAYETARAGWRYGWKIRDHERGGIVARFPDESRNVRIAGVEMRHVRPLSAGSLSGREPWTARQVVAEEE